MIDEYLAIEEEYMSLPGETRRELHIVREANPIRGKATLRWKNETAMPTSENSRSTSGVACRDSNCGETCIIKLKTT
jgi:hypothetical protein